MECRWTAHLAAQAEIAHVFHKRHNFQEAGAVLSIHLWLERNLKSSCLTWCEINRIWGHHPSTIGRFCTGTSRCMNTSCEIKRQVIRDIYSLRLAGCSLRCRLEAENVCTELHCLRDILTFKHQVPTVIPKQARRKNGTWGARDAYSLLQAWWNDWATLPNPVQEVINVMDVDGWRSC